MSKVVNIRITECLNAFREALISLIPFMERIGISWKDGETYDEWDEISETLFKVFISTSLSEYILSDIPLARYGFYYENYKKNSYIAINNKLCVFVEFVSKYSVFDHVRFCNIHKISMDVVEYGCLPVADCKFLFIRNSISILKIE